MKKQESPEWVRILATLSPVGIFRTDAEGLCLYANERACEIAGLAPDEVQGQGWARALHPEDRERVVTAWSQAARENRKFHMEYRFQHPDGTVVWVLGQAVAEKDPNGQVITYVGTLTDITDRKRVEEELRESKEKCCAILESIEEGYYEVDANGNLTASNEALRRLLGYSAEQLLGKNQNDFLQGHEIGRAEVTRQELCQKGAPFRHTTWKIATKDRAERIVEASASPIRNTAGETVGVRGLVRDVTELRQAQLRLIESDRLSALGQMAAGVAHELNNPLQTILGFSELIARAPNLDPAHRRHAEDIHEEAERARKIISNLLNFAHPAPLEKAPVDVNQVVERVLELRGYSLRLANIHIERALEPLPPLLADAHRLEQVFLNLVLNAEYALEKVPGIRQLFLSTERREDPEGPAVCIVVRDTGIGIFPEHLSRLFEPFFTTKPPGQGTGLGLSIAYAVVRDHGGTIEVSSDPSHGTTFTVRLPVIPLRSPSASETPEKPAAAQELKRPSADPQAASRTALVVDDEEHVREFVSECLETRGYAVDTAPNAAQAAARLRRQHYDLVVSDIKMPGQGGIELFQEMLHEQPDLATRFVFMTGDIMSGGTMEFLQAQSVRYLLKPFTMTDLLALLAKVN